MSLLLRRAICTAVLVAGLMCLVVLPFSSAQQPIRQPVKVPPPFDGPVTEVREPTDIDKNITLPRDIALGRKVKAAADYIATKEWVQACQLLQLIVDSDQDVFVPVKRAGVGGIETSIDVSVKREANRMLANLPPEGQEFYKLTYGQIALEKLKEAKEKRSKKLLAEVVRSYLHTDAGVEATGLLATYLLDGGDPDSAAQCYQRLFDRVGIAKVPVLTLFQAAYAFHQSGDTEHENKAWRELSTRTRDLRFGNEVKTVDELKAYINAHGRAMTEVNLSDWPMVNGTPNRAGRGNGDTPFMEARFIDRAIRKTPPSQSAINAETEAALKKAAQNLLTIGGGQPVLSAFSPVTATVNVKGKRCPMVIFRSTWGTHAYDVETGKMQWENSSDWGLDRMFGGTNNDADKRKYAEDWVNQIYLKVRPNMLFENSIIGTLSTNGTFVYMIDDLPLTPPPQANQFNQFNQPNLNLVATGKVGEAMKANVLRAYVLSSGKLIWVLGGNEHGGSYTDTFFLGPPLPISGRLYVMAENGQELELLTLDPMTGLNLIPRQLLGKTREKLAGEAYRRTKAVHLAAGEGMLICPTNAGAVFGYDLLDKSLVWAYHYREVGGSEDMPRPPLGRGYGPPWVNIGDGRVFYPNGCNNWKVTPPIVQDGKVVFTAPDAAKVHCLTVRDGSPLWSVKRGEDDYYLGGVFNGKVLIVGKTIVKALDLATGKQIWATNEAGVPSGMGAASENTYYLPVKEGPASKIPEIVAIDIDTGTITGRVHSRLHEIPGNLVFFDGTVISQTATDLTVYPQMKTKLAQIDELIKKNPKDPVGLTERGELRLDRGDLRGAVEDLTLALENKPPVDVVSRTQARLFDALTNFLLRDFDAAEKYLKHYEDLCKIDVKDVNPITRPALEKEYKRRQANLLCLVGRGKQGQRKLVEAFHKYEEFGELGGDSEDLISTLDEPTVRGRADVLARGRINAMMATASEEERKPLEALVAARWEELKKNSDPEQLRRFVNLYGSQFLAGREARLVLADKLAEDPEPMAMLEAERQLMLLRSQSGGDRRMAARAIEALARLNTRKALLEDAAYYYTLLGTQYPKEIISEGRTGADIYNDLATDKRLQPYLDRRPGLSGSGPLHYESKWGDPRLEIDRVFKRIYHFEQVGERLPFFRGNEVTLHVDQNKLVFADPATGKEAWGQPLRATQFGQIANPQMRRSGESAPPNMSKASVLTLGHLVVLPLGQMVFGIDPVHHKVIWEKDLQAPLPPLPGQTPTGLAMSTLVVDERDNSVQMVFTEGWMQQLAIQTGPLQGYAVYLQSREGLIALDPLTGGVLWVRNDLPSRCHLFGDDQNLYLVEFERGPNPKPVSTRAIRASDGSSVKVPDFTTAYKNRIKTIGRHLLVADAPEKGAAAAPITLRLYDVATGKDLWSVTYEAGSQLLESETSEFVGIVSKGVIHIHDVATGKEFTATPVRDPADIDGHWAAHLLSDHEQVYVAFCRPIDRTQVAINSVYTNVMPGTGMRTLPVNGSVYAFWRKPEKQGKIHWIAPVPNQMLVLEQFEDLPMLLFTSRYHMARPNQSSVEVVKIWSVDKQTGKGLVTNDVIPGGQAFYALRVDTRSGRIEFISSNFTAVHSLNPPEGSK